MSKTCFGVDSVTMSSSGSRGRPPSSANTDFSMQALGMIGPVHSNSEDDGVFTRAGDTTSHVNVLRRLLYLSLRRNIQRRMDYVTPYGSEDEEDKRYMVSDEETAPVGLSKDNGGIHQYTRARKGKRIQTDYDFALQLSVQGDDVNDTLWGLRESAHERNAHGVKAQSDLTHKQDESRRLVERGDAEVAQRLHAQELERIAREQEEEKASMECIQRMQGLDPAQFSSHAPGLGGGGARAVLKGGVALGREVVFGTLSRVNPAHKPTTLNLYGQSDPYDSDSKERERKTEYTADPSFRPRDTRKLQTRGSESDDSLDAASASDQVDDEEPVYTTLVMMGAWTEMAYPQRELFGCKPEGLVAPYTFVREIRPMGSGALLHRLTREMRGRTHWFRHPINIILADVLTVDSSMEGKNPCAQLSFETGDAKIVASRSRISTTAQWSEGKVTKENCSFAFNNAPDNEALLFDDNPIHVPMSYSAISIQLNDAKTGAYFCVYLICKGFSLFLW